MIAMTIEKKTPAGHVRWEDVRKGSPEQIDEVRRWARLVLEGASLGEIREFAGRTQAQVGEAVGVSQVEVGRVERRPDLQLSTLRRYLGALGFDVEVLARHREHPDRAIPLRFPPAATPGAGETEVEKTARGPRGGGVRKGKRTKI